MTARIGEGGERGRRLKQRLRRNGLGCVFPPQRHKGTEDGQDWGRGEQLKYVVKVRETLPSQPALVDAAGPPAGVPRHASGDLEHLVLRCRSSSFWYRRCKMRFVLQAAGR